MENKHYDLIVNLIKEHKKYSICEAILEDIVKDVYEHSKIVLSSVTNDEVLISYLNKVINTSMITVPRKLNFNTRVSHRVITTIPEIKKNDIENISEEQASDGTIINTMDENLSKEDIVIENDIEDNLSELLIDDNNDLDEFLENTEENNDSSDIEKQYLDESVLDIETEDCLLEEDVIENDCETEDIIEEDSLEEELSENIETETVDVVEDTMPAEVDSQTINKDLVDKMINGVVSYEETTEIMDEISSEETELLIEENDDLEELEIIEQDDLIEDSETEFNEVLMEIDDFSSEDEDSIDLDADSEFENLQDNLSEVESLEEVSMLNELEESDDLDTIEELENVELDSELSEENGNDDNDNNENIEEDCVVPKYSCFSFEPVVSEYDKESILENLNELNAKYPNKQIFAVYDYKYNKNYTVSEVATALNKSEDDIINILNDIIDLVKD